jgi:hypothetical protein
MKKTLFIAVILLNIVAFAQTNTNNEVKKTSPAKPKDAHMVSLDSLVAMVNNLKSLYQVAQAALQTDETQLSKETAELAQLNEYSHATLQKYRGVIKAEIISELVLTALMAGAILWLFLMLRKTTNQMEENFDRIEKLIKHK